MGMTSAENSNRGSTSSSSSSAGPANSHGAKGTDSDGSASSSSSSSSGTKNSSGAKANGTDGSASSSNSSGSSTANSSGAKANDRDGTASNSGSLAGAYGTNDAGIHSLASAIGGALDGIGGAIGQALSGNISGAASLAAMHGVDASGLGGLAGAIGSGLSSIGSGIARSLGFESAAGPTNSSASLPGNLGMVQTAMKNAGYSDTAIAGFIGGLQQESYHDLRSTAVSKGDAADGTDSMGMAQWNSSRLAGLKSFAKDRGTDPTDAQTQADFAVHELSTTHAKVGAALKAATTVEQAAQAAVGFEVPAGYSAKDPTNMSKVSGYQNRLNNANNIAAQLAGKTDNSLGTTAATTNYRDPTVNAVNSNDPYGAQQIAAKSISTTPKADLTGAPSKPKGTAESVLNTVGTVLHAAVDPVGFVIGAIDGIGKTNKDGTPKDTVAGIDKNDPLGIASTLSFLSSGAKGSVSDTTGKELGTRVLPTNPVNAAGATDNALASNTAAASTAADPLAGFMASFGSKQPFTTYTLAGLDATNPKLKQLDPFGWGQGNKVA